MCVTQEPELFTMLLLSPGSPHDQETSNPSGDNSIGGEMGQ